MPPHTPEQPHSEFEKIQYKEDVVLYKFSNVGIGIDTSGKNQAEYPELLFATGDTEHGIEMSMDQPPQPIEGVDMEHITECIRAAADDSGIHTFWFYPHGKDVPEEKDHERRSQARLRLFRKYWDVTPSPSGFGYLLQI